jgi:hypothetical protein
LCFAHSTVFSYQGRLEDAGAPANGLHDLRLRLFDSAVGGSQVGTTLCVNNVDVVDGLFTVQLDFGQQFAAVAPRHLDIQVRRDIGQPCTDDFGYVLLSPRQPLTPTPRAQAANVANALAAPDGFPANAVIVTNAGDVGIGTSLPASPLHIVSDVTPVLVIQDSGSASSQAGYVGFRNNAGVETGFMGFGSPTSPSLFVANNRSGGHIQLFPGPGGATIVRGNITLGNSSEFFAPSATENLRLVRGDVRGSDGAILRGAGFTVSKFGEGVYDIFFTPPFSSPPTVTVTAHDYDYTVHHSPFILTASRARVLMRDDGSTADGDFSMCVMGPR